MSTPRVHPSGEQVELVHGEQRAVCVELGGGLRSYRVGERELLDGYALDERCSSGRGQILAPWPNRLQEASYEFEGQELHLPISEPRTGSAIHGLVRWTSWTVAERQPARARLGYRLLPQDGYP